MSKRFWLVLSFIILIPFVSPLFLWFISQAEPQKEPKRDVFLEALNESKHRLSSIEQKGEEYYKHYCSICHGEEGRGDGFNAFNLNPKPKNFAEIIPSVDDKYLYKVISEGTASVGKSALCPPRGLYLERDVIEAIIAYLRVKSERTKR